jgi:hypothetical protein
MAITYPLSLAAFADTLGVRRTKWQLQDNRELSGMGSGQVLQAKLAPSLWVGDVTLREWYHDDAASIEAKLAVLIEQMGSFYLYDPRKWAPRDDPTGAILGAATVQIASLPTPATMSLKGLPAGYKLAAGTDLAFDYGSSPTRRAFHRIAEDVTATGGGSTTAFNVTPFVRPGAAVNASVTLIKPAMKCIIKPGSVDVSSTENILTTQISFSVLQKI